jgi:gas vesicle protein
VDNSKRTNDDHSVNKRINSDDNYSKNESAPWELNIFNKEQVYQEDVGDADDHKPKSDSPIRDALQDVDRTIASSGQTVKKGVQTVVQTGKAFTKPVKRASQWITNMITQWKDKNENEIKEKMADPHSRNNLFKGIKTAIIGGSLFKAGILLNPIFLFLAITKKAGDSKKSFRLRNEIIGELKVELEVIEEKIKDADHKGDNKAKYQLMRFKNEINKKLIRVGGTKEMAKMI